MRTPKIKTLSIMFECMYALHYKKKQHNNPGILSISGIEITNQFIFATKVRRRK
jgi:hypothetical protein